MSWTYRVICDGETYSIREVYKDPFGYTADPVKADAASLEGLRKMLERMLKALEQPVIVV